MSRWLRWSLASSVLCAKKVPQKLKGKFYKVVVVVKPTMLYRMEWWPVKNPPVQKIKVVK